MSYKIWRFFLEVVTTFFGTDLESTAFFSTEGNRGSCFSESFCFPLQKNRNPEVHSKGSPFSDQQLFTQPELFSEKFPEKKTLVKEVIILLR